MTDYAYLVHLLYCAVHGTAPQEKPAEVSFKSVLELGKLHEVANIAYLSVERLENKPEPEVLNDWKLYYFFSVQRDMRQRAAYKNIISALHKNGIRTLEAQGTVTKTFYPSTELRMMSDIDFIIDADKLEKADGILRSLGYETWQHTPEEIEASGDGGLAVELHSDFFTKKIYGGNERFFEAVNSPFSHATPEGENGLKYILDDTYFYLFSVLHILKHYETAGCGIRRILDLYYLKKALLERIDTDYYNGVLEKYGFTENAKLLFALEAEWFEGVKPDVDLSRVAEKVFESENHGTRDVLARTEVNRKLESGEKFARLKGIFAIIFPPKKYIYINYPECEERGYSAVTCWFYRLFRKLSGARLGAALKYVRSLFKK